MDATINKWKTISAVLAFFLLIFGIMLLIKNGDSSSSVASKKLVQIIQERDALQAKKKIILLDIDTLLQAIKKNENSIATLQAQGNNYKDLIKVFQEENNQLKQKARKLLQIIAEKDAIIAEKNAIIKTQKIKIAQLSETSPNAEWLKTIENQDSIIKHQDNQIRDQDTKLRQKEEEIKQLKNEINRQNISNTKYKFWAKFNYNMIYNNPNAKSINTWKRMQINVNAILELFNERAAGQAFKIHLYKNGNSRPMIEKQFIWNNRPQNIFITRAEIGQNINSTDKFELMIIHANTGIQAGLNRLNVTF